MRPDDDPDRVFVHVDDAGPVGRDDVGANAFEFKIGYNCPVEFAADVTEGRGHSNGRESQIDLVKLRTCLRTRFRSSCSIEFFPCA